MPPRSCTPAPPSPPNGPSDWTAAVHGNCFANLERLNRWIGGTTVVPTGNDPSSYFQSVAPNSIGGGTNPPSIYVVIHGWAPGYRAVVNANGGNLLWWGSNASSNGAWASDWAWSPITAPLNPPFPVNGTGLLQAIVALHSKAIVLAYSWIDDSATDSGDLNLQEVYESEAYTHINGIRLANALQKAIAPSFWDALSGRLKLIGHSHGSKVASVAALTLQQRGKRVAQVTILDAPESEITLESNAANLLGFYLEQMQIMHPFFKCASGAFVDNYASYFGVAYAGTANLQNVIEIALDGSKLYAWDDASDQHTYAAAWYGGGAAGAKSNNEPPLGLAWPPPPTSYLPALNQNWAGGAVNQFNQWQLQAGNSIHDVFSYDTEAVAVTTVATDGNVQGDPSTKLVFGATAGSWPTYSIFEGSYRNSPDSDNYGLAFDLLWTAPQVGDYLIVTMESPDLGDQEVLFVMDGQSFPGGMTSIAINCDKSSFIYPLYFYIYFVAAKGNTLGRIDVSNFRFVAVTSASGYLRSRRLARAAESLSKRSVRAPQFPPKLPAS